MHASFMTAFVTERACKRANARAASARANVQTCKKTCKRACEHTLHTCSHGQCDLSVDCTCILLHLRPRKTTQVFCGRRCFTDLDPRACITVVNSWLHIVHTLHATHKPSQVCLSLVRHKRKCRRSYQRDRAKESARGECAAEEERTHDERRL